MKKTEKYFMVSPAAYILFFVGGIWLFLMLAWNVQVPIYETTTGAIQVKERTAQIVIDSAGSQSVNRIYYYVQRDEWIESVEKNEEEDIFVIDNIHELKDGQHVTIDIEVGSISLLEAIFAKGGNL